MSGIIRIVLLGTIMLSVGACSPRQDAWEDDFSDPASGWHVESDASAEAGYYDGVMRILVKSPNRLAWVSPDREYADFRLRVDATQVAGPDDNEYGVLVRMRDANHFYRFSISGDGYYQISKYEGNTWIPLSGDWVLSTAIRTGTATNQLEVVCQGHKLTFLANDQLLTEAEDSSYTRGAIGLFAGSFFESGVEVYFDDITVTAP